MKKYILFVSILAIVFACNDDEPSYDNYWKSLGVYEKTGDGASEFQINLDKGEILIPTDIPGKLESYNDGDRVMVYYTRLENASGANELNAAIHHIDDVLTKDVIVLTPENADSIGNDPIHVHEEDIWISNNYLNIYFSYLGESKVHYLNMVKYPNDSLDSDGRLILEFRHNNNGDYPGYSYDGLVSFDLNSLHQPGLDSIPFVVVVDDFYLDSLTWKDTYYFNVSEKAAKEINIQNPAYLIE